MFTREDILEGNTCPEDYCDDLDTLVEKLNLLEKAYGHELICTSGLRSWKHHLDIYRKKGFKIPELLNNRNEFIKFITENPKSNLKKIPTKSKHLFCQAADVVPKNPKLLDDFKKFIQNNPDLMEEIDIYFEAFSHTPTWVHVQSVSFGSYRKKGNRFFIP